MTKYASPALLLVSLAALAGCPGPDDETNAPTLWLAPDGSEVRVKLAENRPPPW